jgi:Cation efflux family
MSELTVARQAVAHRGRRLEYCPTVWNRPEDLIAVAAGIVAGSISLVGFGMGSFIEVTSGATLLWRMSVDADVESRERNEKLSLRIVGVCFVALAGYIAYESVSVLIRKTSPEHSIPGIVLACVSLIVMPMLSRAKKKVGKALGSAAMKARTLGRLISVPPLDYFVGGTFAECGFSMVVGRSNRCIDHGPDHCKRRD